MNPAGRRAQLDYLIAFAANPGDPAHDFYRQRSMTANYARRYQLAFAGYALAVAAHADPAGREPAGRALGRLIDRLIERPVWEYWAAHGLGPDPVVRFNIMYSGHLAHLIGLYEHLTGDRRFDAGFDLVWDEATRFTYTHTSLVERIHAQMVENHHHGVACEPGLIYFACNNHAAISTLLHDRTHPTAFGAIVADWLAWADRRLAVPAGAFWPRGAVRAVYLERQDIAAPLSVGILDAWTLLFLAAYDPARARALYPRLRRQFKPGRDGGLRLPASPISDRFEITNEAINTAFARAAARELGDTETADRLRRHLEATAGPVERDGLRWYATRPAPIVTALITLGDYLTPDGLAELTLGAAHA